MRCVSFALQICYLDDMMMIDVAGVSLLHIAPLGVMRLLIQFSILGVILQRIKKRGKAPLELIELTLLR